LTGEIESQCHPLPNREARLRYVTPNMSEISDKLKRIFLAVALFPGHHVVRVPLCIFINDLDEFFFAVTRGSLLQLRFPVMAA
jgi:hypothetical protein